MRTFILALIIAASPVGAAFGDTCSDLFAALPKIKGGTPLRASVGGQTYKSLYDTCDKENTFDGRPLPTHEGKPLTCSGDPNKVSSLDKFPDGTIAFQAKASVDADGSKLACGSGWPNQCGTWLEFDAGSKRKDVNAEDTPFVVVPSRMPSTGISFQNDTGIRRGDLAVAYHNGKCSFGVVGDAGPYFRLGEISLRSHVDLGHPRCEHQGEYPCTAIKEVSIPDGVNYLIFPKSRPKPLTSQNVNSVSKKQAEARVKAFIKKYGQ